MFDSAARLVESAKTIRADVNLSEAGQAEQLEALKPEGMDALGQSAQVLVAGHKSLAELEARLYSLQPERAQSPHELSMAATHKLAKLHNPKQAESVDYLRRTIEWIEAAAGQVAATVSADLRIDSEDLLTHFIGRGDNATLEAMGFDAVTIGQARVRLRETA